MTGRRSVWSNPRVIELSEKFVPAADEVWRLQNGTDPECTLFRAMAEHGHYGGRLGTTRQGIYVCSPDGRFLASVNSNRPERVLEMMQGGLKAWESLPDRDSRLTSVERVKPLHRWEDSYPVDGLVLTMIARDLPLECDPSQPCEVKWNQDRVWFSRDEARQWIPQDPLEGARHSLPPDLASRLARFHLVDTVKGQTSRFEPSEVRESAISTVVVERLGSLVKLRIAGNSKGDADRGSRRESPHGVSTRLLGHATYDLERSKFVEFERVALGRWWGRTRYNGRRRDGQSGPLGFVFRLEAADAPRIAPAFISSYDAAWVKHPREATDGALLREENAGPSTGTEGGRGEGRE